jgi:hypothetical protein
MPGYMVWRWFHNVPEQAKANLSDTNSIAVHPCFSLLLNDYAASSSRAATGSSYIVHVLYTTYTCVVHCMILE